MDLTIRFVEPDERGALSERVLNRPIPLATAYEMLRARKALAMEFLVPGGQNSFGHHDPAKGWLMINIFGHPLHADNFSFLRYETVAPGVLSLVAVHMMCDSFDPEHGDEVRWDQHVFLNPPERRRAILNLRSHRVWMVESLVDCGRMAALAARRFGVDCLSDYAAFASPSLVAEALRPLDAFDPDLPGVYDFNPDEDPEESARLMDETWAFENK